MTASLLNYQDIVGPEEIDELRALADRVGGRRMQHINSTSVGGGVAEILTRLVPLLRDLSETFANTRRICIAFNLTMPDEQMFYGNATELYKQFSAKEIKGEFVIVIEGRPTERRAKP